MVILYGVQGNAVQAASGHRLHISRCLLSTKLMGTRLAR